MSHFRLHSKTKGKDRLGYLIIGIVCVLAVGGIGYAAHSIGTASAKSREKILIYTEEELEQYLLDEESEEYNLNGRYQLEEDLELGWLWKSIGTNVEPFTGSFDGNGHVISGLTRPLFGVMKKASVENLFLSETMITNPCTYYDGEHYVDGYGALAAYVVDSEIANCGMGGEIQASNPVETWYQIEKASPAEALEWKELETPEEVTEAVIGPAGDETPERTETEVKGPGVAGGAGNGGAESSVEESSQMENGQPESSSSENSQTESSSSEGSQFESSSSESGQLESSSSESSQPGSSPSESGQSESSPSGSGQPGDSPSENAQPGGSLSENSQPESGSSENSQHESNLSESSQSGNHQEESAQTDKTQADNSINEPDEEPETVALQKIDRQYRMMKLSEVIGPDIEADLAEATPSDAQEVYKPNIATPSEAEKEKENSYMGGDGEALYLAVTADRVLAGGLIAQLEGTTTVTHCFTCATIITQIEHADTWTGGFAGKLGEAVHLENSYSAGVLDGSDRVGGFVADNHGRIENSYSSTALTMSGRVRGGFSAEGNGRFTGCVYDRQMACTDDRNAQEAGSIDEVPSAGKGADGELAIESPSDSAAISLEARNTIQMSGIEEYIPGTWYQADNAYPQIEYFALHENQTIADYSRVSAVTLILPESMTLRNVILEEGQIILPEEMDGQSITWSVEGDIHIDENHQIQMGSRSDSIPEEAETAETPIIPNTIQETVPKSMLEESAESEIPRGPGLERHQETETPRGPGLEERAESEVPRGPGLEEPTDSAAPLGPGLGNSVETTNLQELPVTISMNERLLKTSACEYGETEAKELEPDNGIQKKAQIKAISGVAAKTYSLDITPIADTRAVYANWQELGTAQSEESLKSAGELGGTGTSSDPWQIGSARALAWFMANVNNKTLTAANQNVILTADIDLASEVDASSTPLKFSTIRAANYSAAFDGKGHVISNMRIEEDAENTGLFDSLDGGSITNLTLQNVYVSGKKRTGSIVGSLRRNGNNRITNCHVVEGEVYGGDHVGGITGGSYEYVSLAYITQCSNSAKVETIETSGDGCAGGIVGYLINGTISDCINFGEIYGWDVGHSGGISGITGRVSSGSATIKNCVNVGKVMSKQSGTYGDPITSYMYVYDNNYFDYNVMPVSSEKGKTGLTTAQIQSWAFPYTMNGESMEGYWAYHEGGYPGFGSLTAASGWSAVAQGIKDGLITATETSTNTDGAYVIDTAEKLALFALDVNEGTKTTAAAKLTTNIDLMGSKYGGTAESPLPWKPIGNDIDYTGNFNGDGCYVENLVINNTSNNQGLFGSLGTLALIENLGIQSGRISGGTNSGGITGCVKGDDVKVLRCWNKANINAPDIVAGIVGANFANNLLVDGCWNEGVITATKTNDGGGIVGRVSEETNAMIIRNCYNMGIISGKDYSGGIVGGVRGKEHKILNCYNMGTVSAGAHNSGIATTWGWENCYYLDGTLDGGIKLTDSQFQTWGAAYALNGHKASQDTDTGICWNYNPDISPYPYPVRGEVLEAENWEVVGRAVEDGLLGSSSAVQKPSGNGNAFPYQITTAEQLAWFAYQVNVPKEREIKGVLVNDIDMKAAEGSYISDGRLNWIPIGKDQFYMYQGTFGSKDLSNPDDTHKIYRIQNLYASIEDAAGLFGYVWNGTITRIGLANAQISGTSAGGIAGSLLGTAEAAQCYNRSESPGSGSVTASVNAGGIAGQVSGGVVRDCYNQETVIKGTEASSSAGGIAGSVLGTIRNSYSACGTAGSITAGGSTSAAGAVAGYPDGIMSQCYSDTGWSGDSVSMADSTYVSRLYAAGNTELQKQTAGLNTVNGTQQMKENRIWYTSLASEPTKGWPTLEPPVKMLSLGTVTPVDSSSGTAGEQLSLGTGVTISDAKVRDVSQETTGTQTVSLAEWKTEYYTSWGTTSANGKIGMAGVGGTSAILMPDQMSLENPVQGLGTISGLNVYTGAACTYPTDREILVELSSGNDRYEIRFTIKGVTSKSLVVDLPTGVAMEDVLMPDGTEKTAYSVDTTIKNSQYYPMEGKILKAVPITDKAGYQVLKPIAETTNYGSGQIYNAGVKLGITNPTTGAGVIRGDLYYNPDTPDTNPWMKYQLKGAEGILPYRYFLKYKADPYYESDYPNFGYTISYQFGVMADDYSVAAGAVAFQ